MRLEDRARLGLRVRKLRDRRGLSLAALAKRSGHSGRWIMDLELGRVDPKLGYLLDLARALAVKVEAILSHDGSNDVAAGTLESKEVEETRRREFLALIAATGSGLVDFERLAAPGIDGGWLRDAETISRTIAAQRSRVASASLFPAALGHLGALEARLPAAAELTAQTALLTGSLLVKDGRLAQAYRCYSLAESLGDPVVRSKALTGRASAHARRGDTQRALVLQEHAAATLRGAPPRGRAGVLARLAELRAELGDDLGAMRDLDAAERTIASDGYEWFYLSPEHDHELGAYRGSVLASLGRHREAIEAYEWTLQRMSPDLVNWRTKIAADRDAALAAL